MGILTSKRFNILNHNIQLDCKVITMPPRYFPLQQQQRNTLHFHVMIILLLSYVSNMLNIIKLNK